MAMFGGFPSGVRSNLTPATITPEEAERIRASLGPNGQAAFQQWASGNNVNVGGGSSIPASAEVSVGPSDRVLAPTGMFGSAPQLPFNIAGNVKPSFFGEGGTGRTIVGAIGDALSVAGGGRPVYLPLQLQKRQMEREDARRAADRQAQWQQWVQQEIWKRANPLPPQPTEFERQLDAGGFSPTERQTLIQDYVRNRANPIQAVPFTDEQGQRGLQFVRPSAMAPASSPAAPVVGTVEDGYVFLGGDPSDEKNWRKQ